MARNGTSLIQSHHTLSLAPTCPEATIDWVWQQLQLQLPAQPLDPAIRQHAHGSPAILCFLVAEHLAQPGLPIEELVLNSHQKWLAEVRSCQNPPETRTTDSVAASLCIRCY